MVHTYKRKTSQGSWTETIMKLAIEESKKSSVNAAAKLYNIPLSTLQRHVKKKSAKKKLGRFETNKKLFHLSKSILGLLWKSDQCQL